MPKAPALKGRSPRDSRRADRATRPFWLPAISYYVLSGAVAGAAFFIIWGVFLEGGEEAPWVTAGIVASLLMAAAVVVREVVLREARNRYLANKRRLDRNFRQGLKVSGTTRAGKLTLERHQRMLGRISRKSEAARVLGDLGEGHREVFAICEEYLSITASELRRTDINSPRYSAFRKGRRRVKKLHRYHLMAWTEIESKELLRLATSLEDPVAKMEAAERAESVLASAISQYPHEEKLLESARALSEFRSAVRFAALISEAESDEEAGKIENAVARYRAILEDLEEEEFGESERTVLVERLENKVRELESRTNE